ncbi:UvrD-helicase domain-containing protein [Mucilaginibacter phyllosphaerae]
MKPTEQQQKIIDYDSGSLVIIANPGSGKTFVISEKIKLILPPILEFQGVIAISYTNKASNELKQRCFKDGLNPKGSFFGTIDRFYLREIILPFGKQLFGIPKVDVSVVKRGDLAEEIREEMTWMDEAIDGDNISAAQLLVFKKFFLNGLLVLESVSLLALHIFKNSIACQRYLKARYTHIIIDEYQDCGLEQHLLFLRIQKLGLTAIAVGDANQSIFQFSGKSSEFLLELGGRKSEFRLFPLEFNHRCHPSIVNYSLLLLNSEAELLEAKELRVFEKQIIGNEAQIANWLDLNITAMQKKYKVSDFNKIGILVHNGRTGKIINQGLHTPHKYFENTPLDEDFTIWSGIFRDILSLSFDRSISKTLFLDSFIDTELNRKTAIAVLKIIEEIAVTLSVMDPKVDELIKKFIAVAVALHPAGNNKRSIELLREVLSSAILLSIYRPAQDGEVQIMTIHKSKGLEFDAVLHLDLYEWILPYKNYADGSYPNLSQDVNLHYVGITRAKKCCVLIHTTKRTNYKMEIKNGNPSEFLKFDALNDRRIQLSK